jgi:hypothetical protein
MNEERLTAKELEESIQEMQERLDALKEYL